MSSGSSIKAQRGQLLSTLKEQQTRMYDNEVSSEISCKVMPNQINNASIACYDAQSSK